MELLKLRTLKRFPGAETQPCVWALTFVLMWVFCNPEEGSCRAGNTYFCKEGTFTPVRMAIINKSANSKCWRGCGEKGTIVHCWWECRLVPPLWKSVWDFLRKLKMELPFDPAIPLLGLYPKNPETPIQKNLCSPMFIEEQFTIAKCWKQSKCPLVNEWIKKKFF